MKKSSINNSQVMPLKRQNYNYLFIEERNLFEENPFIEVGHKINILDKHGISQIEESNFIINRILPLGPYGTMPISFKDGFRYKVAALGPYSRAPEIFKVNLD